MRRPISDQVLPDVQWRKFLERVWHERTLLFTALISAIGKSLSATGFALALREVFESATLHGGRLFISVLIALGLALLSAGFGVGNRYTVVWLVQRVVHDVRQNILAKLMVLAPGTIAQRGRAGILDVAGHDTDRLDRMAMSLVGTIIPSALMVVGYTIGLIMIVPAFGAISICIGAVYWLATRLIQKNIFVQSNAFASAFAQFNKGVLLTVERLGIIRAGGLTVLELEERKQDLSNLLGIAISTDQSIGATFESLSLVGNVVTVALLIVASTIGAPASVVPDIMTAYLLLFMIRSQVVAIGTTMPDLRMGIAAFARIQQLLELPDELAYSGSKKVAFKGNLALSNLSFSYGEKTVLSRVSLTVQQGSKLAITGANGSGKTTLVNLLLGIYRPGAGYITAEGVLYDEVDLPALLASVGYVPQDPIIFAGTIAENISYGQPSATLQQIEHAARLAGAHHFIKQLPAEYDTEVGDMGVCLSGGQKQQIALSRALLGHHSLLILDEPTNHLDQGAIRALLKTLADGEDAPTIIIVTHDRNLFGCMDKVFELSEGTLFQQGEVINFVPARDATHQTSQSADG